MVELVVSDVDGTLITPDHVVTERSREAIRGLRAQGMRFTVASSRPPRGLKPVVSAFGVEMPFAAFNGGMIIAPDFTVLEEHPLDPEFAVKVLDEIIALGLDPWLYRGQEWWVTDRRGPRVAREASAVGFEPEVTADLLPLALAPAPLKGAMKIVGVSLDPAKVAAAEAALRGRWAGQAQVSRSHAAYVDVTHLEANKARAVERLAERAGVDLGRVAVIGDMPNDVAMFERAGFSIAMGNASDEVKRRAKTTTSSNREEGFAVAMERYILGRAPV